MENLLASAPKFPQSLALGFYKKEFLWKKNRLKGRHSLIDNILLQSQVVQ